MTINNAHILFVEDLQEDGQVVQAIRRFQKTAQANAQPAAQTTTTPETKK